MGGETWSIICIHNKMGEKGMTSRLIFYLHKHRARQLQVPSWASVPAKQMSLVVHVERALLGSMA